MERVMGFEPTAFCLGSRHSTTELHPLADHHSLLLTLTFSNLRSSPGAQSRQTEELGAAARVFTEASPVHARDNLATGLLDAAHDHTEMLRFDHHSSPNRIQRGNQSVGDLRGEPLLDLWTAREDVGD